VSLLAGSYSGTWKIYREILGRVLTGKEQEEVLYYSAKDFYTIKTRHKVSNSWK